MTEMKVEKSVKGKLDITDIRYVDMEKFTEVVDLTVEESITRHCGDTDISHIGDGTFTGALYVVNETIGDVAIASTGFYDKTTTFNDDGSITEVTPLGTTNVVFNADGSITETYVNSGGVTRVRTTTFNADGSIEEVVTENV